MWASLPPRKNEGKVMPGEAVTPDAGPELLLNC